MTLFSGTPRASRLGQSFALVATSGGFASQVIYTITMTVWGLTLLGIAATYDLSVADFAIGGSLYGALNAGCSFIWGHLHDRIGIRKTATLACLGAGVMMTLVGLTSGFSATLTIILYALTGSLISGVGASFPPKFLATWFMPTHRGKGAVAVTIGGPLGGILAGVIIPLFVGFGGWHSAYIILGVAYMLLSVFIFAVIRDNPESIGAKPLGCKEKSDDQPAQAEPTMKQGQKKNMLKSTLEILKMPITWKLGIIMMLYQGYQITFQTYWSASVVEMGFTLVVAGLALSTMNIAKMIGQVIFPTLTDVFIRKSVLIAEAVVAAVLWIVFFFSRQSLNSATLLASVGLIGFFAGLTPILATCLTESFPPGIRGAGPGIVHTLAMVGTFFGPLLLGWLANTFFAGRLLLLFPFLSIVYALVATLAFFWLPKTGGRKGLDPLANDRKKLVDVEKEMDADRLNDQGEYNSISLSEG